MCVYTRRSSYITHIKDLFTYMLVYSYNNGAAHMIIGILTYRYDMLANICNLKGTLRYPKLQRYSSHI